MNLDLLSTSGHCSSLRSLVLAMVALIYPMFRDQGDDQGDGMALVLLPATELPHLGRTLAFIVTFVTLSCYTTASTGQHSPTRSTSRALLGRQHVVVAPAQVAGFSTASPWGCESWSSDR